MEALVGYGRLLISILCLSLQFFLGRLRFWTMGFGLCFWFSLLVDLMSHGLLF